ncbi:tRNA-uridine aminocarboxypropyltransferase [Shewanella gaetbuli]|uniref:tRNA-uridine aminocarboxypropyltransferase n=1 Tax=Shewanella gaetbuli TaxID=220752 RepID=A0A9X1ZRP1_9GAMM|nr:tRNA-uridine aminocarboxypropyltransferase [Shewanella gaetbuli]MCL1142858.1 DTW domain-containing protein [Shewanella gaetbuli]
MTRQYCNQCHFPQTSCVCSAVAPVRSKTEVIVMQHPSEVNHAKNSVRLMPLVLANMQIVVGETAADFTELRQYLAQANKPVYIIYPSETSQTVQQSGAQADAIIVLLDGTWRKAYRMLQLNPWLQQYPALHLEVEHASQYVIRKAKRADSLSTLEAAAFMLSSLDKQLDTSPLLNVFDAMVNLRLQAMPAAVRQRYSLQSKDE